MRARLELQRRSSNLINNQFGLITKMKYNLVDFDDDSVLDVHLNLIGMNKTPENRKTLKVIGKELALLFGREDIRHIELETYLSRPANMIRLI